MSKKFEKNARNKFCAYTGKRTSNKDVIICKYALDYIKSMGYVVLGNPLTQSTYFEHEK